MHSAMSRQSTRAPHLCQSASRMAEAQTNVRLIHLEVDPEYIAPIKFIFEAYEEVAIVRTVDRHRAVIVLLVAPDFFAVAHAILASVQQEFVCREIPRPAGDNDDWLMREVTDWGPEA